MHSWRIGLQEYCSCRGDEGLSSKRAVDIRDINMSFNVLSINVTARLSEINLKTDNMWAF